MKKILNFVLVCALLLIQVVPVSALSGTNNNNGSITINDALKGKKYSIYEILVLESYDTAKNAYTYKVDTESDWNDFFQSPEIKGVYVNVEAGTNIVTWVTNADVKAFSEKALAYAKANNIAPTATETATDTTVVFERLNLGYYLVDSSLGALCGLTTTNPDAVVNEKNGEPTIDKTVKENSTGQYGDSNTDYIGKTIEFRTLVDVKQGAENYVLHDVLSDGFTLDQTSITVTLDGTTVPATYEVEGVTKTNYTVTFKTKDDVVNGFVITFDNEFVKPLTDNNELYVYYEAELNTKAVVGSTGNPNETWLIYGENHETQHDTTRTYTYRFELVKVDSSKNVLTGAKFKLYDKKTGGNEIPVVYDSTLGGYRLAKTGETGVEIEVGSAKIIGLDNGTYYLGETQAPNGYNKLTSRVEVTIAGANLDANILNNVYQSGGIAVTNLTGAELPSTGGMGTTLFITVGSIMAIGFGLLLVTKLRVSKED